MNKLKIPNKMKILDNLWLSEIKLRKKYIIKTHLKLSQIKLKKIIPKKIVKILNSNWFHPNKTNN